jgi:hypothetical protein
MTQGTHSEFTAFPANAWPQKTQETQKEELALLRFLSFLRPQFRSPPMRPAHDLGTIMFTALASRPPNDASP